IPETEALLGQGYGRDVPSMKSLGYRQIAGYLAGDYGYEEAVRQLKRDTRHFAKRQMTWFRREPSIRWVAISEGEAAEATAQRLLELIGDYLARLKTAAGGDGRRHGSSHTVAV
ncbi:MAG: tRNA dimethylallyltransferase, partial [Nitrospirales bacterium]